MSIFDEVEDETPTSIGEEIGSVLSAAIQDINKNNQQANAIIIQAITTALRSVDNKEIVVRKSEVRKWTFKVERDGKGLMTKITATAE